MRSFATSMVFLFALAGWASAQMAPKTSHTGAPTSVLRNDAPSAVTVEFRSETGWQQLKLEAGADTTVAGDRVRVATTRDDKAVITVDLPIVPGKKYRLLWNTQAGMWDFSPVV